MQCHRRFKITRYLTVTGKTAGVRVGGILLLACLSLLSGCVSAIQATCAPYLEQTRRAGITTKARSEARQTWAEFHADRCSGDKNAADAKHGFITGYVETALGFVNSPPPVPTRRFISIHTLTHGYPNANAWYSGYHQGAASAMSKSVDQWRLAPIYPGLLPPQDAYQAASELSDLHLELPVGSMIEAAPDVEGEIYNGPEQPSALPTVIPTPEDPEPLLQQNSELNMNPTEADFL